MLDTALALLAAKAKTVALVAGTAAVTAGAVGGGTLALQSVSDSSDLPATSVSAPDTATPTVTVGIGKQGKGRGAERRSDTATAVLTGADPAPVVTFSCDPSLNHGQNVSAYARSLPKGPGRGQQVSAAAQSDCGKDAGEVEAAEVEEVEPSQAPKASRSPKPAKPAKSAEPAETEDADDESDDDAAEADVEDAPAKPEKAVKAKGRGKG